jgi:hypothetical protein
LAAALGLAGLVWGSFHIPQSETADYFREIEGRLLRYKTVTPSRSAEILASQAAKDLSACDTHAQRALLLLEMPLTLAALRSGSAAEFDRRVDSLEARSRRILGCAPRDSFAWLLLFNMEVVHGRLSEHSFDLLAMSYETSPNEAWISIRRIVMAMPLVLTAPEPLRRKILKEFKLLVGNGFVDDAARAYSASSQQIRSLLQMQLEQLDPLQQKRFMDALQKLGS